MSDFCSCGDGEYADVYSKVTRKARKSHICNECNEVIEPGDIYYYSSWLFEGEWSHEKICEYCEHDLNIVQKLGMCPDRGLLKEAWAKL